MPEATIGAISAHHEHWDGGGYPDGLSGEEIPLAGRIVAIADEVESLISQEPSPLLARRNLPSWLTRFSGSHAKPGILTVEELDVLRQHPVYSRDIVAGITGFEEVAEWVAAHHERPDGRGYPDGLKGDEIPLEARILAVADAYVAITSDRPHREKVDRSDGVRMLRRAAGSQLDAELVELFVSSVA